jgi:hypothetical protein
MFWMKITKNLTQQPQENELPFLALLLNLLSQQKSQHKFSKYS